MERQRSFSRKKMYIPQKNVENSASEEDIVLERIVSNFLIYMDVNALRERAIQNIQNKIAIIEKSEQISKVRKRKGRNNRVISFQNSFGCVVRMSDDYNFLSNKSLPITNLNRKKKPLKLIKRIPQHNKDNERVKKLQEISVCQNLKLLELSRRMSQGYNKDAKRLERVQKLSALRQKLEKKEKSLKLAQQISQQNIDKRIKGLQDISICEKLKSSELSRQMSQGYKKDNKRLETILKLSDLNQKLENKEKSLELSRQISQDYNKDSKRLESVQKLSILSQNLENKEKSLKLSKRISQHNNKNNKRIVSAQDLPALNQKSEIKDELLGPMHLIHIKIPVVRYVPPDSLKISRELWKVNNHYSNQKEIAGLHENKRPVHSSRIKIPVVRYVPPDSLQIARKKRQEKYRYLRKKKLTRLLGNEETKLRNENEKEKS